MDLALRPMSTSQVLDRTFHLYRNNFVLLAGIGSLLPIMLLTMEFAFIPLGFPPTVRGKQSPEAAQIMLLWYVSSFILVYLVGSTLTGGATVFGVSKLHLGQNVTIGQAYKQVFSRFWRLIGIVTLIGLILFGIGLVLGILYAFAIGLLTLASSTSARPVVALVLGFSLIIALVLTIMLCYTRLSLAVPACILEQLPVGRSLRRSWSLSKGSVWRLFLVYLLTGILGVALSIALGLPGQMMMRFMSGKGILFGVILNQVGGFIAGVIAGPIATTAIAMIYYDQRVRKEAFDLQLMMEAVGEQIQVQAAAAAAAAPIPPAIG